MEQELSLTSWQAICLCVDTGAVVLIWLVQLVIYPAYRHISPNGFSRWHIDYKKRVAIVVMPLMLGQLCMSAYPVVVGLVQWSDQGLASVIYLASVLITWWLTFWLFVPLHRSFGTGDYTQNSFDKLVKYNWWRTGVWTLILGYNLVRFVLVPG